MRLVLIIFAALHAIAAMVVGAAYMAFLALFWFVALVVLGVAAVLEGLHEAGMRRLKKVPADK